MTEEKKQFRCRRCGNCCRWPGAVRVETAEIDRIAAFLGMAVEQFLAEYTELLPDRSGLTLPEKPDGSCCFLEEGSPARCRIEPVKPAQCRRFPEHWNFPGWEREYTGDSRTVDLHVQRLKKKLGWEDHISAVYRVGYRLET